MVVALGESLRPIAANRPNEPQAIYQVRVKVTTKWYRGSPLQTISDPILDVIACCDILALSIVRTIPLKKAVSEIRYADSSI